MTMRWLIAILSLVVIGGLTVGLRQQRLRTMHEAIQLHRDAGKQRQILWDQQVRLSEMVSTPQLRQALIDAGLQLVPMPAESANPQANPQTNLSDDGNPLGDLPGSPLEGELVAIAPAHDALAARDPGDAAFQAAIANGHVIPLMRPTDTDSTSSPERE